MPKSNSQKQTDRRKRERAWLKRNGFTSWEAVHTALMNGKYFIARPTPKGKS